RNNCWLIGATGSFIAIHQVATNSFIDAFWVHELQVCLAQKMAKCTKAKYMKRLFWGQSIAHKILKFSTIFEST
ncbi:MAG: hypothetical protein ACPL7A_01830, partial [Anaerolineales bacterium]